MFRPLLNWYTCTASCKSVLNHSLAFHHRYNFSSSAIIKQHSSILDKHYYSLCFKFQLKSLLFGIFLLSIHLQSKFHYSKWKQLQLIMALSAGLAPSFLFIVQNHLSTIAVAVYKYNNVRHCFHSIFDRNSEPGNYSWRRGLFWNTAYVEIGFQKFVIFFVSAFLPSTKSFDS